MSELVRPDGRPARVDPDRCPHCGADRKERVNTAGFGDPVICCGKCGHEFTGVTE